MDGGKQPPPSPPQALARPLLIPPPPPPGSKPNPSNRFPGILFCLPQPTPNRAISVAQRGSWSGPQPGCPVRLLLLSLPARPSTSGLTLLSLSFHICQMVIFFFKKEARPLNVLSHAFIWAIRYFMSITLQGSQSTAKPLKISEPRVPLFTIPMYA